MDSPPQPTVAWESPEPQPGPAPGIEFAPHGPRLVAYILDSIILTIVEIPLFLVAIVVLYAGAVVSRGRVVSIEPGSALLFLLLLLVCLLVALLYFPFFWARGGQTPGMRPFGLRVVRDHDGSRIGWGTALLRLIGIYVAAAVLYIGFIWIFIDKRRRGWQDLIAGTVVVKQP